MAQWEINQQGNKKRYSEKKQRHQWDKKEEHGKNHNHIEHLGKQEKQGIHHIVIMAAGHRKFG